MPLGALMPSTGAFWAAQNGNRRHKRRRIGGYLAAHLSQLKIFTKPFISHNQITAQKRLAVASRRRDNPISGLSNA